MNHNHGGRPMEGQHGTSCEGMHEPAMMRRLGMLALNLAEST